MKILISILVSTILAAFAFYKKSLTRKATFLAWIMAIIITYCGGVMGFMILLMTFLGTIACGKIGNHKRKTIPEVQQKTGTRDTIQVLANVGVATFSLLLYHITKNDIFTIAYASVMASSLADSMASELGILSNHQPMDIITLKKVNRGVSGGITIEGLGSSLLGSILIAITFLITTKSTIFPFIIITIFGFLGAFIDSILGSLIQVKYRCSVCHQITEKTKHCHQNTIYEKGIKWINNDIINILNNIITFLLVVILLIYIN